jgi:Zn-dependent protease
MITCPACGTLHPAEVLACPACHRLVHSQRLSELAEQATAAEKAGEITQALAIWREALDLLPGETNQAATIRKHIAQLCERVDRAAPAKAGNAKSPGQKALASLGVVGMLIWKLKVVLLFALTKGKLLLLGLTKASTFLSMFVAFGAYWTLWGWRFALGFVVAMYIHEIGHVDALRRYGFKASAPMFLPGLGAVVRLRQSLTNPIENARIGLAGPIWGMGATVACYLAYLFTQAPIWAALCHVSAWLNLFNLLPIEPLDGGRGFGSLSRMQALMVAGAFGTAWFVTAEGLLLLIAIVAMVRSLSKPADAAADRISFASFIVLIASLSALACVRAPG